MSDWETMVGVMQNVNDRAQELARLSSQVLAEARLMDESARNMATVTNVLSDVAPKVKAAQVRYCVPVGTDAERASGDVWPGAWVDATGFCVWYFDKWWHTGADLNLNAPHFDADRSAPVYAIADGEVYAVRDYDGWGRVLCIKHAECLSRYAHVEDVRVEEGAQVETGQQIARIGNAGGRYPYHLHFDIARVSARMARYPGDWPGADKQRVLSDYLDPLGFLKSRIGE